MLKNWMNAPIRLFEDIVILLCLVILLYLDIFYIFVNQHILHILYYHHSITHIYFSKITKHGLD